MNIVEATKADIESIKSLAYTIWHQHYIPIIGLEQVNYMLTKMYDCESLKRQMIEGHKFYMIQDNATDIGFISIVYNENDVLFLNKFYIDTTHQNKGIGGKALVAILKMFPESKAMRLQVNRKNYKSINFYFKMGFVIEEVADFDIGDGYLMEDFVMVLTIR